jgi:hypothetical protein
MNSGSKHLNALSSAVYCVSPEGGSRFVCELNRCVILNTQKRQDSVVSILTRLRGWMAWGTNCSRGKRFVSTPKPPTWFCSPCNFLFIGYCSSFQRGTVARV